MGAYQHFSQDLVETKYNCRDEPNQACITYKNNGWCGTAHIQQYCRQTCGVCHLPQPNGPQPHGPCRDDDPNCALYRSKGYCYAEHVWRVCRKSCGKCAN